MGIFPRILTTLLVCVGGFNMLKAGAEERIRLTPSMVINESALGDASTLVDEQGTIGDPAAGTGQRPTHAFFPGWATWQYPLHVVIDLGRNHKLTSVYLYNESGESTVQISSGKPGAWANQDVKLTGYRNWQRIEAPAEVTRYIRITLLKPTTLPEIALYGAPFGPAEMKRTVMRVVPRPHPTFDQFIGVNAFIDDPIDLITPTVGFVREYHNWSWDTEGPGGLVRFNPSGAAGGNAWFFDNYYAKLLAGGVTVCPALQGTSPAAFPGYKADFKPVTKGENTELPASYAVHAAHMYQYAARYGAAKVPESAVHLAPDQPVKTGLGLLHYFENWNEPDKTWKGREGRFSPFELAAMCSADYDGDQGRMGDGYGVKAADKSARLSIGGLAGIGIDYLDAMKLWADTFRGGSFPADVINVHHYSSDGTAEQPFRNTGISPEEDHLKEKMQTVTAWRNKNAPGAEVWLSELGYDVNPKSPFHAPAIGHFTAEDTQANWLVRSCMALAAAGVDRTAVFMFRDVKTGGGGVFETCGLVTEKGQWKPRASYWYLATLKSRLSGMRFASEVQTERKDVLIYRFVAEGKTAWVLWRPTAEDGTSKDVSLIVDKPTVKRIQFKAGSKTGVEDSLVPKSGAIHLDVTEQPVIVMQEG